MSGGNGEESEWEEKVGYKGGLPKSGYEEWVWRVYACEDCVKIRLQISQRCSTDIVIVIVVME